MVDPLNKLIAEKIMGFHDVKATKRSDCEAEWLQLEGYKKVNFAGSERDWHEYIPDYLDDVAGAMEVFEKISETFAVSLHSYHPGWNCSIMEHGTCKTLSSQNNLSISQAICLAALEAYGLL